MKRSKTIVKISAALLKAQQKIGVAKKGSINPFYKSKYANLGEVMRVCKETLNENGIIVLQPLGITKNGGEYVETILLHISGEYITGRQKLTFEKITPQEQGKAITYARRYSLQSMLFIPAEDDDAESVEKVYRQPITRRAPRPVTSSAPKYPTKPVAKTPSKDIPF